ncbi:MAG: lipid A biosynthesis acyltransferase, partial [Odoribacter sp.]
MKILTFVLSYVGYGLLWSVSFLPLPVMYLITDFFFLLLFFVIRYRRKVVNTNLANAFPEKTEQERRLIARRYYHHLCDTFAEFYKLWHISEAEIKRRCVMVNMDIPHRYFAEGRSIIACSGHYGNWEMMYSYKLWEKDIELVPIYKPIRNKVLDRMTFSIRSRFGAHPLAKLDTLRVMLRNKDEGKVAMTGFIGDQTPNKANLNFWMDFLNQDTPILEGTEKIARKLNQPVVFVNMRKVKRGYYQAEFYDICSEPKAT